jgi:potassium channel subfamily K
MSFFVFWSLLAVPTITILISNIGDTLIRFIRDMTLFIGEITILPGDQSFVDKIKDLYHTSLIGWWLEETTGEKTSSPKDKTSTATGNANNSAGPNNVSGHLEAEEQEKEKHAHQQGDIVAENIHHYNYLLFREVRKMIDYASNHPTRQFDYLEWEYYLGLIAGKNKPDVSGDESNKNQAQAVNDWSWIDKESPLMGHKSEVEWLLGALTKALERELREASGVQIFESENEASGEVDGEAEVGDGSQGQGPRQRQQNDAIP